MRLAGKGGQIPSVSVSKFVVARRSDCDWSSVTLAKSRSFGRATPSTRRPTVSYLDQCGVIPACINSMIVRPKDDRIYAQMTDTS